MVDPATRPVMLVRALRGCGESGRTVHVIALSDDTGPPGLLDALCGTALVGDEVETVEPGVGVPCAGCLLYRDVTAHPPPMSISSYREWAWPVRSSADQVLLDLGGECTAVVLPAGLARAVTAILAGRDRRVPVLVNPGTPQERILVAGEPYGVPLPWPGGVRLVTGALALPPGTTPCGSLRWGAVAPGPESGRVPGNRHLQRGAYHPARRRRCRAWVREMNGISNRSHEKLAERGSGAPVRRRVGR